MRYLYVFIDESGNLHFSTEGTKYFVMAAVSMISPIEISDKLQELKYKLLCEGNGGNEYEYFHASEDRQITRDKVFEIISNLKDKIKINYVFADKRKKNPVMSAADFYNLVSGAIAKYLLKKYGDSEKFDKIIIIFDKMLSKKEQDGFYKQAKPVLKEIGKPYAIYFHRTLSDFNGQVADYCAWAKYVELERGEGRPMKSLVVVNKSEFDIFEKGTTLHY